MAKASPEYVVNQPFMRTDHTTGLDARYELGDRYSGPDVDAYIDRGLIVPAPAGPSQPGDAGSNEEGKSE